MPSLKRKKIIIIGASEHGKIALNILYYQKNLEFAGFLDDNKMADKEVIGKVFDWPKYAKYFFHLAIGDNSIREKFFKILNKGNCRFINLIHPKAFIEKDVVLGESVFAGANAYINIGSRIGSGTIINNGCNVDHHNIIGDFCHLAPGVITGGGVKIAAGVFVGLNSAIRDHIEIGENSFIGMGSVITKNIEKNLLVYNRLEMKIKKLS